MNNYEILYKFKTCMKKLMPACYKCTSMQPTESSLSIKNLSVKRNEEWKSHMSGLFTVQCTY